MSYQPKNAQAIINGVKLGLVTHLVSAQGHNLADCPAAELCKITLAVEYLIDKGPENITPLNPAFFPANLHVPRTYQPDAEVNPCGIIAVLSDKETRQPFTVCAVVPNIYRNAGVFDALTLLNEEENVVAAIQWLVELFNTGIHGVVLNDHGRFMAHFLNPALHTIDPALGHGGTHGRKYIRHSQLALADRRSNIWYLAPQTPDIVGNWRARDASTLMGGAIWDNKQHVTQGGMIEVNRANKEGRLELSIIQGVKTYTHSGKAPEIEWDVLLKTANEWKVKAIKDANKPSAKKKKATAAAEIPPWAYGEDGTIQMRYTYIQRKDEVPEEHREPMVKQFTEELMNEYNERQGHHPIPTPAF